MANEFSIVIDWSVWVPIIIAAISLVISIYQMRKKSEVDSMQQVEKTIDKAHKALKECESNLKQCGREKDELRREKFALLEQIASKARSTDHDT